MSSTKYKAAGRSSGLKSTRIGTPFNKLARNLTDDFDQYVLKEETQQKNEEQQKIEEQQNNDIKQKKQSIQKKRISSLNSKQKMSNRKSINKSRQSIGYQKSRQLAQKSIQSMNAIPRSYLLAMEHLQQVVEKRNSQILQLKQQLLQKQQMIFECESRINEILNKYQTLTDMYSLKQNQVIILKQEIQEIRYDKQIALKQAAKAIQIQFKNQSKFIHCNPLEFTTFKQRSMSVNALGQYLDPKQSNINYGSKQYNIMEKNDNMKSMKSSNRNYFDDKASELLNQKLQLESNKKNVLITYRDKQKDYISYQRQIIRNQKQLVALKYRMECLQRKLFTDPKEKSVKEKIRKLSQQIQSKQKSINDLKRL